MIWIEIKSQPVQEMVDNNRRGEIQSSHVSYESTEFIPGHAKDSSLMSEAATGSGLG